MKITFKRHKKYLTFLTSTTLMMGAVSPSFAANGLGEMLLKEIVNEVQKGQSTQKQSQPSPTPTATPQRRGQSQANSPKEPPFPSDVANYDGPARFSPVMRVSSSKLDFDLTEDSFPLEKQEFGGAGINSSMYVRWPTIQCTYRLSTDRNIFRTASFWYKNRPEIYTPNKDEAGRQQFIKWIGSSDVNNDIALTTCPTTWGEAMTVAWGTGAWSRKQAMYAEYQQQQNTQNGAYEQQVQKEESQWRQGKLVANSKEKDTQLTAQIDEIMQDMWNRRSSFNFDSFKYEVIKKIDPLMVQLARSGLAQANKIPKGEKGWKQFEAWDNGIGFTVVYLNWVLRDKFDKEAISNTESGRIWRYYLDLYKAQIADKGAIDPKYLAKIQNDLKKLRDANYTGIEPKLNTFKQGARITLNGEESALYSATSQAVNAAATVVEGRAFIKAQINETNDLIEKTRKDFWSCYESRCNNGAAYLVDYSKMLFRKDNMNADAVYTARLYSNMNAGQKNSENSGEVLTQKLFGVEEVDGGPIHGCKVYWDHFTNKINDVTRAGAYSKSFGEFFSTPENYKKIFSGPEFTEYQSCRDIMEFVLRDRSKNGYLKK